MDYSKVSDYQIKRGIIDGVCQTPRSIQNNRDGKKYPKVNLTMIDDPHIVKGMIPMTDGRSLYRLDSVCHNCKEQYQPFAKTIYECFEKAKELFSNSFVFHNDDCFIYTHPQTFSYRQITKGHPSRFDLQYVGNITFEECATAALNSDQSLNFIAIPEDAESSVEIPCYLYNIPEDQINNQTVLTNLFSDMNENTSKWTYKVFQRPRFDDFTICSSGLYKDKKIGCKKCPSGKYKFMESKAYATTCDETEAHLNITKDFSGKGGGQGCTNADRSEECCLTFGGCLTNDDTIIPQCTMVSTQHCIDCPLGKYQDDMGAFVCKTCPRGTYQNETGQVGFKVCPKGKITKGIGSNSSSQCDGKCKSDDKGDIVLNGLTCQECGDGLYEKEDNCTECPTGTFKRKIIKYGTDKVAEKPKNVDYTMYIDTDCSDKSSSPETALEAFQAAYQYLFVKYNQDTAMLLNSEYIEDDWEDYYIHYDDRKCHYFLSNVTSSDSDQVCVQYSSGPIDERVDHTTIDPDRERQFQNFSSHWKEYNDYVQRSTGRPGDELNNSIGGQNNNLTIEECMEAGNYFKVWNRHIEGRGYDPPMGVDPIRCSFRWIQGYSSKRKYLIYRTTDHYANRDCNNYFGTEACIDKIERQECKFPGYSIKFPEGVYTTSPTPQGINTKDDFCQKCPAGKYSDQKGLSSCKFCPSGTYQNDIGASTCKSVPRGHQTDQYRTGVVKCPATTFSDGYRSEQRFVNESNYTSSISAKHVETCKEYAYRHQDIDRFVFENEQCIFNPQLDTSNSLKLLYLKGSSSCSTCPVNTINKKTGQTRCYSCPAGHVASVDNSECIPCNPGEFQDTGDEYTKIFGNGNLSPNAYRISLGNKSTCDDTMDCNAYDDQYMYNLPTKNIEFANDIWIKNVNSKSCEKCPEGHVQPFKASTECHRCDINTYEPRTGQPGDVSAAFFDHRIYDQPDDILESTDGIITIDTCIKHAKINQYHFVQLRTPKCHLWRDQPAIEKHPKYYEIVKGSVQNSPKKASHFQDCTVTQLSNYIYFNGTHCTYDVSANTGNDNIYLEEIKMSEYSALYEVRPLCTLTCEAPRYNTQRGSTECSQECNKILQSHIKIENRFRALGVPQGELASPFDWTPKSSEFVINRQRYKVTPTPLEVCPNATENHNIEFVNSQIKAKDFFLNSSMRLSRQSSLILDMSKDQIILARRNAEDPLECLAVIENTLTVANCRQPLTKGWSRSNLRLRFRDKCMEIDQNNITFSACAPCKGYTETYNTKTIDIFDLRTLDCSFDIVDDADTEDKCRDESINRFNESQGYYVFDNGLCKVFKKMHPNGYCLDRLTNFNHSSVTKNIIDNRQILSYQEPCRECEDGHEYKDGACRLCPTGKISTGGQYCQACPENTIYHDPSFCRKSYPGTENDSPCPKGSYQPLEGKDSCIPCEPGKFQNKIQQYYCSDCIPGYFQDESGQSSCKICQAGSYQTQYSSTVCTPTDKGNSQPLQGALAQIKCPPGEYQDQIGQATCKACPKGQYQPEYEKEACLSCTAGRYMDKTGHVEFAAEIVKSDMVVFDSYDKYDGYTLGECAERAFNTRDQSSLMFFHSSILCGVYNDKPYTVTQGLCPHDKSKENCRGKLLRPFIESAPDVFALRISENEALLWGYYGRHPYDDGSGLDPYRAWDLPLNLPNTFNDVESIVSNHKAFVILHRDKSLSIHGYASHGGTMPDDNMIGIKRVVACGLGFAATFANDSTIVWGQYNIGMQEHVTDIKCTEDTFVLKYEDSTTSVIDAKSHMCRYHLQDVKDVLSNMKTQASKNFNPTILVLFTNGTLHGWGHLNNFDAPGELFDAIYATRDSFGAVTRRRTFKTWGTITEEQNHQSIVDVFATNLEFLVLTIHGEFYSVPDNYDLELRRRSNFKVVSVYVARYAGFALLDENKRMITWGNQISNHDCESGDYTTSSISCYDVPSGISDGNIVDIKTTEGSFIALTADGMAVGWGKSTHAVIEALTNDPSATRRRKRTYNVKGVQTHRFGISFILKDGSISTLGYYDYDTTRKSDTSTPRGFLYFRLAFPNNAYRHPPTGCVDYNGDITFVEADYRIECSESNKCYCNTDFVAEFIDSPNTNIYRASDNCFIAPAGYFANTPKAEKAIPCEPGTYQDQSEATECKDCEAGTFSPLQASTYCLTCPDGTGSLEASKECTNCTKGKYGHEGFCHKCPKGQYQDQEGQSACKVCELGKYQDQEGQEECQWCPVGSYVDYTAATECIPTPKGYEYDDNMTKGLPCPSGYYKNVTGYYNCTECPTGRYTDDEGSETCKACPLGQYQNLTGEYECISCANGQYQDQEGQTSCKECDVGKYSSKDQYKGHPMATCLKCGINEKTSDLGQTSCDPCPTGKYKSTIGKGSCAEAFDESICRPSYESVNGSCVRCLVGQYSDGSECIDKSSSCPKGQGYVFNNYRDQDHCKNCTEGFYSDGDNQESCKAKKRRCDPGYELIPTNNQKDNLCQACPKDYYNTNGRTCISCKEQQGNSYYTNETGATSCTRGCEYKNYTNKTGTYYEPTNIAYQPPVTLSTNQFGSLETAIHDTLEKAEDACVGACDGVSQYSNGNWSAGVERSSTVSSHVSGLRKLNQREERTIEYDHWNCDHSTLIGGYFDMRQECQTSDWTNEGGCDVQFTLVDSGEIYGNASKYTSESEARLNCDKTGNTRNNVCEGISHWYVSVSNGVCSGDYAPLTQSECAGKSSGYFNMCDFNHNCRYIATGSGTCSNIERSMQGNGWGTTDCTKVGGYGAISTRAWDIKCMENGAHYTFDGLYCYKFKCFCQYWTAGPAGYSSGDTLVSSKKKKYFQGQIRTHESGRNCNLKKLSQEVKC